MTNSMSMKVIATVLIIGVTVCLLGSTLALFRLNESGISITQEYNFYPQDVLWISAGKSHWTGQHHLSVDISTLPRTHVRTLYVANINWPHLSLSLVCITSPFENDIHGCPSTQLNFR